MVLDLSWFFLFIFLFFCFGMIGSSSFGPAHRAHPLAAFVPRGRLTLGSHYSCLHTPSECNGTPASASHTRTHDDNVRRDGDLTPAAHLAAGFITPSVVVLGASHTGDPLLQPPHAEGVQWVPSKRLAQATIITLNDTSRKRRDC